MINFLRLQAFNALLIVFLLFVILSLESYHYGTHDLDYVLEQGELNFIKLGI